MPRHLTPYDRGYVLEPKPWPTAHSSDPAGWTGEEENAFGRVDFDNDEGGTDFAGLRILPAGSTRGGVPLTVPSIEFSTSAVEVEIRCIDDESTRIKVAFQQPVDTLERAVERGARAVDIIADHGDPAETQLKDVLTDLIHWAEAQGIDVDGFEEAVDEAFRMVDTEVQEWAVKS